MRRIAFGLISAVMSLVVVPASASPPGRFGVGGEGLSRRAAGAVLAIRRHHERFAHRRFHGLRRSGSRFHVGYGSYGAPFATGYGPAFVERSRPMADPPLPFHGHVTASVGIPPSPSAPPTLYVIERESARRSVRFGSPDRPGPRIVTREGRRWTGDGGAETGAAWTAPRVVYVTILRRN